MNPHRPIDLDSLDEEFLSSTKAAAENEAQENQVFSNLSSDDKQIRSLHPSLTADVIEGLMNVKIQQNGPVFHDLPEEGDKNVKPSPEPEALKRTPQISEEEALKSFPAFDFDMSIFESENGSNDIAAPLSEKEQIKAHKAKASQELKEEKARIKTQHKLEKKVQKPFRQRRIIAFFMALFLLFGILAAAVTAALYLTDTLPETTLSIADYSVLFVNGTDIKSSKYENYIVILKNESVKSSRPVLFKADDGRRIEDIVAIGDGVCAVNISNRISAVSTDNIESIVFFSSDSIGSLYKIIRSEIYKVAIVFGIYFVAVIAFFSALILMKNQKIKKYRESYELVS